MHITITTIFTSATDPHNWTATRYGKETKWRLADETAPGDYIEGFNQPPEFDINPAPFVLDEAGKCRYLCQNDPSASPSVSAIQRSLCCRSECVSWVWRANLHECYLKNDYDPYRSTILPCDDCVAHATKADYYLQWTPLKTPQFQPYSRLIQREEAISRCAYTTGLDQPAKYDLHDTPLTKDSAFLCCNACYEEPRTDLLFLC